jgi:hypothetical protein
MVSQGVTRWITALVMAVALALVFAPTCATYAASGRNNTNAKLCQKGGWQNYQRTDGTRFVNDVRNGGICPEITEIEALSAF